MKEKELYRGKYDLPETEWLVDNIRWEVVYDVVENGKPITKRVLLHPNQHNLARVDEPCTFHIKSVPNLHNGGEWEDMAIIETTDLKINTHLMEQILNKSGLQPISWKNPADGVSVKVEDVLKLTQEMIETIRNPENKYTDEEVHEIVQQTLTRLINENGTK